MPVTIAQVQASIHRGTQVQYLTLNDVFPLPPLPLLREQALGMLQVGLQLGECWHGDLDNGVMPLFPDAQQYIAETAARQVDRAKRAIERVEAVPPGAVALNKKDEETFLKGWGGKEMLNASRLITVLMWNSASEMEAFRYIGSVCRRMLISSASVATVSLPLFVGWRDWNRNGVTTSWHRAKTLLTAHEYEIMIHTNYERRQASASLSAPPSTHGSPGHMPSLTHRQATRSGVNEEELRRRWA